MDRKSVLTGVVLFLCVLGEVIDADQLLAAERAIPPGHQPPVVNVYSWREIKLVEDILVREPENRQAWVRLGDMLYDTSQVMKAIDAYDRALRIDGNDADVLTDQGLLFRRIGWFDKAIKNFIRANNTDPEHASSFFNLGIVYWQDLGDQVKALAAWNRYLELVPAGHGAEEVKKMINNMDQQTQLIPSAGGQTAR